MGPIAMTADRPAGGLGRKLREARERKGVSLRQIANSTKISVSVLTALERNDASRLPGGIYGRAFVRAFATEVGLDPETTIQEFIAQFRDESVSAGHPPSEQIEDNESLESNRRMASAFLRLIALSIPIAGVILYFGIAGRRPSPPEAVDQESAAAPSSPLGPVGQTGPAAPADIPVTGAAAHVVAGDGALSARGADAQLPAAGVPVNRLVINLTVSRPCWVAAIVDGRREIERLMQPGERGDLDVRRELVLTVGDASAVSMAMNGVGARPLGKDGEVVTTRVTLANFTTYLPPR